MNAFLRRRNAYSDHWIVFFLKKLDENADVSDSKVVQMLGCRARSPNSKKETRPWIHNEKGNVYMYVYNLQNTCCFWFCPPTSRDGSTPQTTRSHRFSTEKSSMPGMATEERLDRAVVYWQWVQYPQTPQNDHFHLTNQQICHGAKFGRNILFWELVLIFGLGVIQFSGSDLVVHIKQSLWASNNKPDGWIVPARQYRPLQIQVTTILWSFAVVLCL